MDTIDGVLLIFYLWWKEIPWKDSLYFASAKNRMAWNLPLVDESSKGLTNEQVSQPSS